MTNQVSDYLNLEVDHECRKRVSMAGGSGEAVRFSSCVTKVNRKQKSQERILLITNKAIYNIIKKSFKVKRRVPIESISSCTTMDNEEFVIYVRGDNQKDYTYKSDKLGQIIDLLNLLYTDITSRRLIVEGSYVPAPIQRMPTNSHSGGGGGSSHFGSATPYGNVDAGMRHPSHGGGSTSSAASPSPYTNGNPNMDPYTRNVQTKNNLNMKVKLNTQSTPHPFHQPSQQQQFAQPPPLQQFSGHAQPPHQQQQYAQQPPMHGQQLPQQYAHGGSFEHHPSQHAPSHHSSSSSHSYDANPPLHAPAPSRHAHGHSVSQHEMQHAAYGAAQQTGYPPAQQQPQGGYGYGAPPQAKPHQQKHQQQGRPKKKKNPRDWAADQAEEVLLDQDSVQARLEERQREIFEAKRRENTAALKKAETKIEEIDPKHRIPGTRQKIPVMDTLALSGNPKIMRLTLNSQGNPEFVYFSGYVHKISAAGRKQKRVLLITALGIYNILADNLNKCKRRIDVRRLESVSRSQGASDQFVVHVNGDYDYLFESIDKDDIVRTIAGAYEKLMKTKLPIRYLMAGDLSVAREKREKIHFGVLGRKKKDAGLAVETFTTMGVQEDREKELPMNWEQRYDHNGQVKYYNVVTKTSQYKFPEHSESYNFAF